MIQKIKDDGQRIKRIEGLLSFVVPFALFLVLCAHLRIAPFGDRTFLYEDMKEQYIDFYAYFRAVLHGKDSLIYSGNAGIGADMFGTWAYYLSSLFVLIFAFVPERLLPVVISIFIDLKISAVGFTTWLFLEEIDKKTEKAPEYSFNIAALICSTAFAFSGWCIANMTNSMWLDAVIMLPILGLSILKTVRGDKRSTLFMTITVMVMIIENYYIAAMILVFTVMLAIILLLFKAVSLKNVLRAALGALIGIILDLWLLIPVAGSIFGSNKDHSGIVAKAFELYLPKCESLGKSLTPIMILPKIFSASYDGLEIMEGLPNIYFGTVLLLPFVMFFMNKRISLKEKMVAATSLTVLIIFFCNKKLDDIAHFGTEPYGYLYRYSFLFSFACLVFIYRELRNLEGISTISLLISLGVSLALLYLTKWSHIRFMDDRTIWVNLILVICGFLLAMVCMHTVINGKRLYLPLTLLALILILDLSYNFERVYVCSAFNARPVSEYRKKCQEIENKLAVISKDTSDDYRIESLSRMTPNDSLHFGYNSVTTYNSLQKVENRLLLYRMGFNDNGLYAPYEEGNTRTCDALMGIKYILTDALTLHEGQEMFADGIIRNDYVLSKDFISGNTVDDVLQLFDDNDNPFDVQEKLLAAFIASTGQASTNIVSGTDALVPTIFHEATIVSVNESDDQVTYTVTSQFDGEVYFYMDRENLRERSLEVYVNDDFLTPYGNASCQKILHIGHFKTGDNFQLTIKTDGSPIPTEPIIVTEGIQALGEWLTD